MHFRLLPSALLFLLATSPASAQNASDIVNALRGVGLTSLADAISNVTNTTVGKNVLSQLTSGGNYTVFAPTNAAFSNASSALAGDTDRLASILSYHVVQGSFVNHSASNGSPDYLQSATFPSVIVGRTLLTSNGSESYVNLEAGNGQALVWANNATNANQTRYFINTSPEITIANATAVTSSILLAPISGILIPPSNLTAVLAALPEEASSISGIVSITGSESGGSIITRLQSNETRGFTLFAPNNDAVQAAGSSLTSLSTNETAVEIVIGNHYVNGSTFYSPQITNSTSLVSASGQSFTFMANSTGVFVTSSNVTAQIVKSDVLVENGVVHFIDKVLFNLDQNSAAASSAYASATSTAAAGASSTVTGPVAASTQTSASSSGGNNAATRSMDGGLTTTIAGMFAMVASVLFI